MPLPTTYLFVPGNRPDRFDKALNSGADAIILDLEDAVDPASKDAAREAVGVWLDNGHATDGGVLIRINDDTTPWYGGDCVLLDRFPAVGVVLPKAERAEQIATLPKSGVIVPLIETARGLRAVDEIAAADRVQRLAFGTLDFAAGLDLSGDERGLIPPAMMIALASRCAEKAPPIAGVTPAIDDTDALKRDLDFARAFGFTAKLCIHPRQVAAVRQALAPTPAEPARARRVTPGAEAGTGAVQLDGRMVDRPVLLKARSILDRAPS